MESLPTERQSSPRSYTRGQLTIASGAWGLGLGPAAEESNVQGAADCAPAPIEQPTMAPCQQPTLYVAQLLEPDKDWSHLKKPTRIAQEADDVDGQLFLEMHPHLAPLDEYLEAHPHPEDIDTGPAEGDDDGSPPQNSGTSDTYWQDLASDHEQRYPGSGDFFADVLQEAHEARALEGQSDVKEEPEDACQPPYVPFQTQEGSPGMDPDMHPALRALLTLRGGDAQEWFDGAAPFLEMMHINQLAWGTRKLRPYVCTRS